MLSYFFSCQHKLWILFLLLLLLFKSMKIFKFFDCCCCCWQWPVSWTRAAGADPVRYPMIRPSSGGNWLAEWWHSNSTSLTRRISAAAAVDWIGLWWIKDVASFISLLSSTILFTPSLGCSSFMYIYIYKYKNGQRSMLHAAACYGAAMC